LIYDNDSSFNQLSLSEENILNTPSLKYPTKLQVWDSKILNMPSLKYTTKLQVWDSKILSVSDKNSSLGLKSPEQAVVDLSDNKEINNMSESTPNQRMYLENEIINIINKEHSKINM